MLGIIELSTEQLTGTLSQTAELTGVIDTPDNLSGEMEYGTVKVVNNDYEVLRNKPSINEVELIGNRTSEDIGVLDVDDTMTVKMVNDIWDAIFK